MQACCIALAHLKSECYEREGPCVKYDSSTRINLAQRALDQTKLVGVLTQQDS